jgi:omega-amidase
MQEQAVLQVALVQSELAWRDPARNLVHLESLLGTCGPGADIVVLPETFTTGFLGDAPSSDEDMDGPTVAWLREMTARHRCVLTGSTVVAADGRRTNRMLWVLPDGSIEYYDKHHLFSLVGEDRRYRAGTRRVVLHYRGWRFCPQICYDIRFPVWCRNRDDYDVLLVVANWPAARDEAWSTLLQARAIENQSYVVAVNCVGEDGKGVAYHGQSVVHGPAGDTLLKLGAEEQCATVALDLETVRSARRKMPFQADADAFEMSNR